MTQSNVIFAAIFVAYLIFITMRGEVPIYLGLLLKSPATTSAATAGTQSVVNAAQVENAATATASLAGFY